MATPKHAEQGSYTNEYGQTTCTCSCGEAFDPPFASHVAKKLEDRRREKAIADAQAAALKELNELAASEG
jgi:hypothetical protein